jgi:hypothetical protein
MFLLLVTLIKKNNFVLYGTRANSETSERIMQIQKM